MYHGRIKKLGAPVDSLSGVFGSVRKPSETLEDLWPFVEVWMGGHVPNWAIPRQPKILEFMALLKHIGPNTEGYICKVDSCAVFGYKFVSDRLMSVPTVMVLEVWDDSRDISLPEKFWENFDVRLT